MPSMQRWHGGLLTGRGVPMNIRYSEYDSLPAGRRRACVRYTHEDFFARFRILAPALVPLHARATKVDCEALLRLAESPTPSADAESKGAPARPTHAREHTHTFRSIPISSRADPAHALRATDGAAH